MIKNFINEYPYTNLTYANIDWLIKKVKELSGDTEDTDAGIQAFLGAYANEYPYSSLTYANIDWLIKNVGGLDSEVTKLSAQMETLQADVDNIGDKFGDKVDKLGTKNVVYATDGSTPAKTIGIQYMESPFEGTIPIRDGIGSLQVPTAQDATQAVNKGQMDTALDGKVNKTTAKQIVYARDSAGNESALSYDVEATAGVAVRGPNGVLKVGIPVANDDATTKEYVDHAIATAGVVDQSYNPESENAQSGTAVAEALQTLDKKYELIETIALTEDVTQIERTTSPDGEAYNFKKLFIDYKSSQSMSNVRVQGNYKFGNNPFSYNCYVAANHTMGYIEIDASDVLKYYGAGGISSAYTVQWCTTGTYAQIRKADSITSLKIGGTPTLSTGTIINIYGVKA